jgi:prepilin-type processing-associated H-X9-DG protein
MNEGAIPYPRKQRPRGRLLLYLLAATSCATLAVLIVRANYFAGESANRMRCKKQMSAIGQSLMLYANENRGAYPPALKDLIRTQDVTPEVFICPSSNDTPATGDVHEQRVANLEAAGHCSYIYLGTGMHWNSEPEKVLLFESMSNHGTGFHMVFCDGHSEFITGPNASRIESELRHGKNPPPSYLPQSLHNSASRPTAN